MTLAIAGVVATSSLTCSSRPPFVRYEVRLRDGGSVPVSVRYVLPTGDELEVRGMTPWTSEEFDFAEAEILRVAASADVPSRQLDSPLQCVLVGGGDTGAWTQGHIGDPFNRCRTVYELGQWPPNDNEGYLIRVG
jgi:hypothetical protein